MKEMKDKYDTEFARLQDSLNIRIKEFNELAKNNNTLMKTNESLK